jgi:hypothetical protein
MKRKQNDLSIHLFRTFAHRSKPCTFCFIEEWPVKNDPVKKHQYDILWVLWTQSFGKDDGKTTSLSFERFTCAPNAAGARTGK